MINREEYLEELREKQADLEHIYRNRPPITVVNEVAGDTTPFPDDFQFVNRKISRGDLFIREPTTRERCRCGLNRRRECVKDLCRCSQNNDEIDCEFLGKLHRRTLTYECTAMCRCANTSSNRLVQSGAGFNLCVFRKANGRWGVRAEEDIEIRCRNRRGDLLERCSAKKKEEVRRRQQNDLLLHAGWR